MARRIKRFFVFLFFSLFFSLLSGRINTPVPQRGKQVKPSLGLNSASAAGACCEKGICSDDKGNYCCE